MLKKLIYKFSLVITIFTLLIGINLKNADALGISGASSVSPNSSFNVTVTGLANIKGKFYVSVENGSCSPSSFFANGSSSQTISIKAGSSGNVKITVSPDTSTDTATIDGTLVTSSVSKTVTIKSSSNSSSSNNSSSNSNSSSSNNSSSNSNQTNTTTEDTRSKDNTLSSLSVSEGTLSPKFSSSKTKYDIDLSGTVTEVKISAKANDSKAKVSGTGTKSVKVGDTTYKVVCTAENGSTKTYTLTFHVDETPLIYTEYNDVSLGVVRILDDVKAPKNFEKGTTKLDGQEVDAFINKDLNLSLVYLTDDKGNEDFYIVSDEKVISKYQTLTVNGKTYVIVNAPDSLKGVEDLKSSTIKIGDIELSGWQFENEALSHYSLVYLMNDVGESGLYTYEDTEGTLQKYTPVEEKRDNTLTYVFIGTTAVFVVSTAVMGYLYLSFKKKSISAIKDYYERKNQG